MKDDLLCVCGEGVFLLNIKHAKIVFLVTLILVLPARAYQLLFLLDSKTNTYKDGGLFSLILLSVLALSTVLIIIMCLSNKNAPKEYEPIKNVPTAVICALTGAAIIFHSFVSMAEVKENAAQTSLSIIGVAAGSGQLQAMRIFLSFFGILAGLVILITAYNFLLGVNMFHSFPLVALVPPLWGCINLAVLFVTDTASVNVAENAFDMFTVIFTLLFLFTQSRLLAGIDVQANTKSVYMFGLPCILLALATSLPDTVVRLLGKDAVSSLTMSSHLVNLCMAFYIVLFLISLQRDRSPAQKHRFAPKAKNADAPAKGMRKL